MGENNGAHRNGLFTFCTYWLSRKRALCVSFRCVLGGFSRLFSILDYNFCTLDTASNSNRAVSILEFRISPQTFGEILDLQISLTCHKEWTYKHRLLLLEHSMKFCQNCGTSQRIAGSSYICGNVEKKFRNIRILALEIIREIHRVHNQLFLI